MVTMTWCVCWVCFHYSPLCFMCFCARSAQKCAKTLKSQRKLAKHSQNTIETQHILCFNCRLLIFYCVSNDRVNCERWDIHLDCPHWGNYMGFIWCLMSKVKGPTIKKQFVFSHVSIRLRFWIQIT